ncbi:MAG: peptidoglycan-binding protein [Acidimicrobiales bacterium]|nr:peptidoglycan-binding protein [Acidimicrobiales bacterium]
MTRRQRSRLAIGAASVVAVLAGLWALSSRSVSPEQRLAEAEPPPAATVDLEVERRALADTILVRGQVAVRDEIDVMAPGAAAAGGEGATPSVAIVGDLPYPVGAEVPPGGVAAVVSDRPVIVVPMSLPMHRSLSPGAEGPDVERLQQSLVELGYGVTVDGTFGPGTQEAVRRLYQDRGFEPLTTGPELDDAVTAAQDGAEAAASVLHQAEQAWNAAVASGDPAQTAAAEQPLADAQAASAAAAQALSEAQAQVGVVVPLGELVGIGEFPVVVAELPVAVGQVAAEGAVVVLSPSDLVVQAQVDPTRSSLLRPGITGTAAVEGDDTRFDVVVAEAGGAGGSEGGEGDPTAAASATAAVTTFSPTAPLPADLLGRTVTVEVVLAASDGEVLAVPTGAVRADGDGEYLMVVGDDGETHKVRFTPGIAIGGWVEITDPAEPLDAGDVVRAG